MILLSDDLLLEQSVAWCHELLLRRLLHIRLHFVKHRVNISQVVLKLTNIEPFPCEEVPPILRPLEKGLLGLLGIGRLVPRAEILLSVLLIILFVGQLIIKLIDGPRSRLHLSGVGPGAVALRTKQVLRVGPLLLDTDLIALVQEPLQSCTGFKRGAHTR